MKALPLEPRFWSKVEKTDACWNWKGGLRNGYGAFTITLSKGSYRPSYAHRIAYKLLKGEIPTNLQIDHLCRNRACVNPKHMELVTRKENLRRGYSPQAINARKTHCVHGHPLEGGNLLSAPLRIGKRQCRICHNARRRKN